MKSAMEMGWCRAGRGITKCSHFLVKFDLRLSNVFSKLQNKRHDLTPETCSLSGETETAWPRTGLQHKMDRSLIAI